MRKDRINIIVNINKNTCYEQIKFGEKMYFTCWKVHMIGDVFSMVLHIIQSRHPISVTDVNLCIVDVKMPLVQHPKQYEEIYIKAAQR